MGPRDVLLPARQGLNDLNLLRFEGLFGARAQIVVGVTCFVLGLAAWGYGATLHGGALLKFVYHVSMFFGLVACYAIVATGLGYRKTEHVETKVVAQIDHADVSAEEVNVEEEPSGGDQEA